MTKTFSEELRRKYQQTPDQVILTMLEQGQNDQSLTYKELIDGSFAYSQLYKSSGIQPGEVVILILQHGRDLINAFWGAILYGAIPSIMPFLTEKLLPERYREGLSSLISITRPSAIVTYPDFKNEVEMFLREGVSSVRAIILSNQVKNCISTDFSKLPGMSCKPQNIVLLQHSSGTTGLQKGVALSHEAVFNQLESYSRVIQLKAEDVVVSWLPLYHDMGLIAGFLMPILTGTHLVIMSPFEWVRAPYRLMQAVSKYNGTLSWLPNFAYNFCAQKVRDRHLEGVDLSTWRAVINCSEPMRWDSHLEFLNRFEPFGLRADALQTCYAMAENVFAVTHGGVDAPVNVDVISREALQIEGKARPVAENQSSIKMLSAGRPIDNTQVKVIDFEGNSLPDRCIGELVVSSNCMLTEYYHRPDVTETAFVAGWYATGDYGYIADGEIYITGRKKDLIIVGGKNIYPQDLEHLAMEVPGVHPGRVIAFGIFNDQTGTEDVVVVAEVDTEDSLERKKIADLVRRVITRGSAVVPRQVYLVDRHWIVKTSSGKKARSATKQKYLETKSVDK